MNEAYVIEIGTLPTGIVQRVRSGFRMYAALDLGTPDGERFATPWRAQNAADELFLTRLARHEKLARNWTGCASDMVCVSRAGLFTVLDGLEIEHAS